MALLPAPPRLPALRLPAPPLANPLTPLQRLMSAELGRLLGANRFPEEQYTEPPGDPGLFGPASVTWRVHADISMLVGGISALMLQALHPLAMAGVADHSDYRHEPLRRLSRTSSFVVATTYGATPVAEAVIEVVRAVHRRVVGTAPDGRHYDASDPELLRWVHVAEVSSFLAANRRYHPWPVRGGDVDRYLSETAVVAERLGATCVPASRAHVRAYLRQVRADLAVGQQGRDALDFLLRPYGKDPVTRGVSSILSEAALDLLPYWAQELHGVRRPPLLDRALVRPAAYSLLMGARIVGGTSPVVTQARARCRAAAA